MCGVALTATAGWLIVRASEQPPVLMLMVAIVGVRAFGLGRPAARYAERLISHDVGLRELAVERARVYDLLVPLVPGRIGGRRRGELLTTIVDDVDSLLDDRLRVRLPAFTAGAVLGLCAALALVTLRGPVLAAALLAVLLAGLAGLAAWLTGRYAVGALAVRTLRRRAALSTRTLATLDDARDLLVWNQAAGARDEVAAAGRALGNATLATARRTALGRMAPYVAAALGVLGVAALGDPALAAGQVSAPVLALLLLLPLALVDVVTPLADAGALRVTTRDARARIDALATVLPALSAPIADPSGEQPMLSTAAVDLRWHAVAGAWPTTGSTTPAAAPLALSPTGLDLPAGTHLGIVGPSGCGKSTLAALLVRFLDPAAGRYTVAALDAGEGVEHDVRALDPDELRARIGLVDDDPYLFASSVAENVRLARPEADDAEVAAALRAARLDLWLADLPRGLHTPIGDGALAVSGGERARIGLARALLADTRILVLDEPTAHLDAGTAAALTADLLRSGHGRSVVWITHDTHGLADMDVVLDLGVDSARRSKLPDSAPQPS